jgi:deoxyribose-phosphate aldolase
MDEDLEQEQRPPLATYEDVAGMIDLPLVQPNLTNEQVFAGLELAKRYKVASAVVRPCDIDLAVRTLQGSGVRPCSVAGFPHGNQNTATKLYEVRDQLRRGAKEIEMVIAIPRLLSREFQYVQTEIDQAAESCQKDGAILKVVMETAYLTRELKIIGIVCCERAGVDMVVTSTGFAPGTYSAQDIQLIREHMPEEAGAKAVGEFSTVDQVIEAHAQGWTRVSASDTARILDEWKARLAAQAPAPATT